MIAGGEATLTSCKNSGAITYKVANAPNYYFEGLSVAGVSTDAKSLTGRSNSGKVTVDATALKGKSTTEDIGIAGIASFAYGVKKCSNTGAISLNKGYCAGGVFGYLDAGKKTVSDLYNKGKITGGGDSKIRAAAIAGYYEVPYSKNTVKNTYYTFGKGIVNASYVKNQQAKPKKVSSITAKNCSGLSSKYWTYSSKYKRLVLKNDKEV